VSRQSGMLAIVAPTFNQVSETFVADHARALSPGATVLVCQDGRRAERFGHPVLSDIGPAKPWAGGPGRLRTAVAAPLRRRFGFGPLLGFDERLRLANFLRAHAVTVALAEFGYAGVLVAEACAMAGVPLFVCFRGHDATLPARLPSLRRRYRRMFAQAEGIVAESRFIAGKVAALGCPEAKLSVLASGMEGGSYRPAESEPGRIVGIGRFVEMKAPQLTVAAFAAIAGRFPQAHLDLVGDGVLMPRVAALVAEKGLGGRVTLHGYQSHAACAALMARASIFVQHSLTDADGAVEGFPVAIAEAMATGLPIVSTRHSGIPEHVEHGVSGLLVAEGDVDGMAAALARLLDDPAAAQAMGRAGRAYALANLDRAEAHRRLRAIMGLPEAGPEAESEARPGAALEPEPLAAAR
jgi:colanic acid/amylovoran biosynthesis glycosyltransferase